MNVVVEPLTPEKYEEARRISNAFVGTKRMCCVCPYSLCPDSASEFSELYDEEPRLRAFTGLAVRQSDGVALGFVQMSVPELPQSAANRLLHTLREGECYIEQIAVLPEARGQGAGSAMMRWCEDVARGHGSKFMSLSVVKGNPAARLYERFGFETVEQGGLSSCCTALLVCCLLGMPHMRCGADYMEKPLD